MLSHKNLYAMTEYYRVLEILLYCIVFNLVNNTCVQHQLQLFGHLLYLRHFIDMFICHFMHLA